MDVCFLGRQKARAHPPTDNTEGQGSRAAAAVSDGARRQHRQRCNSVHHLREKSYKAEPSAYMAPRFAPLSNNLVEPSLCGLHSLSNRADDLNGHCSGCFDTIHVTSRVAPEE
jgi:hypothetical protein